MSSEQYEGGNSSSNTRATYTADVRSGQFEKSFWKTIKKEERQERDLVFANLEHMLCSLGFTDGNKAYESTQYDDGSTLRSKILGKLIGRSFRKDGMFIAVNTEKSHPNPELQDVVRLEMQAFLVRPLDKLVVSSGVSISDRRVTAKAWPVDDSFGPYVYVHPDLGFAELRHWDTERLQLPEQYIGYNALSLEAGRQVDNTHILTGALAHIKPHEDRKYDVLAV